MDDDLNVTPAATKAFLNNDIHNFFIAATKGGIEQQEKAGQDKFVNSTTLPKDSPWEKLEKIGIIKKDEVDNLFANCILPEGWKKVATDHSMWSELRDEKGRKRASIFYKAAFYDQRAFLRLNKRFEISIVPEDFYKSDKNYEERQSGKWAVIIKDGDEIIFSTSWINLPNYSNYPQRKKAEENIRAKALKWINENYPKWEDELAYWD